MATRFRMRDGWHVAMRPLALGALIGFAPVSVAAQTLPLTTRASLASDPNEVAESDALRVLRLADEELFGGVQSNLIAGESPPWLTQGWALPDIPAQWDSHIVKYVDFFRNDSRGHSIIETWLRRKAEYDAPIRAELRAQGLPEDLIYVAMIESGFNPRARSEVQALGMWQFLAGTGETYGLRHSYWVDERMDPEASTRAAGRYLGDLHQRFGSWELALAAYNMGYGALLRSIRKYNTNDFWALSRYEDGIPYETTLYVAKILGAAVVGRNQERLGFGPAIPSAPALARIEVPAATPFSLIAEATGLGISELRAYNPELIRDRTPPDEDTHELRVPAVSAELFHRQWPRLAHRLGSEKRYVTRFGERLDDVAKRFALTRSVLARMNQAGESESIAYGTTLLVPATAIEHATARREELPIATVPDDHFDTVGRTRIFYRTNDGDTIRSISRYFGLNSDDVRRWNGLAAHACLQNGMMIQLFVESHTDLSRALVLREHEVRVLVAGSDEFFDYHEAQRGRIRTHYRVAANDTLESLGRKFDLSTGSLSRINHFDRHIALRPGQEIIVYAPRGHQPEIAQVPTPDIHADDTGIVAGCPIDADDDDADDDTPTAPPDSAPRDLATDTVSNTAEADSTAH